MRELRTFMMQRVAASLDQQVRESMSGLSIPEPVYDLDVDAVRQWVASFNEEGCKTTRDAIDFVNAASFYFLCKRCTDETTSKYIDDATFDEVRLAEDLYKNPTLKLDDPALYSKNADLRALEEYLLANRVFVRSFVLDDRLTEANPEDRLAYLAAMPNFFQWLSDSVLANDSETTGQEKLLCTAARNCADMLAQRFRSLNNALAGGNSP